MGCFGDMTPTKEVTGTVAPPKWVQNAGKDNYARAQDVFNQGFQPYTDPRVAQLSTNERTASDLVRTLAGSGNPYNGIAATDFQNYGAAPGFNYNFNTVVDPNGPLGSVQGYMDPYLESVLAPILRQIGISGAQARQGINANATQAGAYGDARHGVVESEQLKNQALQESDAVGKTYSDAFNAAMGLRETDAGRQFSTQQAQENADKAALERMRTSGIDLTGLDKYNTSRDLGLASALGQTGATERGIQQQTDDTAFSEFMRKNNFTDDQVAYLTAILKGTPTATTTSGSQTTSQPNNSGWDALGTIAGSLLLAPFTGGASLGAGTIGSLMNLDNNNGPISAVI